MTRLGVLALFLVGCATVGVGRQKGGSRSVITNLVAEIEANKLLMPQACARIRAIGHEPQSTDPDASEYHKLQTDLCRAGADVSPDDPNNRLLIGTDIRAIVAIANHPGFSPEMQNMAVERLLTIIRSTASQGTLATIRRDVGDGWCLDNKLVKFCSQLHARQSEVNAAFEGQQESISQRVSEREASEKERLRKELLVSEERQRKEKAEGDAIKKGISDLIAKHRAQELDPNSAYKLSQNPYAYKGKTLFMRLAYVKNLGPTNALFTAWPESDYLEMISRRNFVDSNEDVFFCAFKVLGTTTILVDAKKLEIPALREVECLME